MKMVLFWGRPGIRFAAQKIITKGAKISRKLAQKKGVSACPGLHDEVQIALGVPWFDRPLEFSFRKVI
jgi:hypothetical protein